MYPKWLWPAVLSPGILWLILLFIVPLYAVLCVAFGGVDPIIQTPQPAWNPLEWNAQVAVDTLSRFSPGREYWSVSIRTVTYVAIAVAGCLIIGYPVAYYVAVHAGKTKKPLLALLVLPLWISYQMRLLAWVNIFSADGYINRLLAFSGMTERPPDWLNGNPTSVVLALMYGYLPYLILPLVASLDRIDRRLIEAGRDLGASPFSVFIHVTLPLSKAGILGACVIVALPMFGDYYTTNIVSGSPRTSMLGNQIDIYFHGGPQPTAGAVITLLLATFLSILMTYYMLSVAKTRGIHH